MEYGKSARRLASLVESVGKGGPTFSDRAEAEEWIRRKAREYGSQAKLQSSPEYHAAYAEIEKAYAATARDEIAQRWKDIESLGFRKGATVTARVARVSHLFGGSGHVRATGKLVSGKDGEPVLKSQTPVEIPGRRRALKTFKVTADMLVSD